MESLTISSIRRGSGLVLIYDRQFVTPFVKTRLAASSPGAGARQRPGDRKGVRPRENQIRFGDRKSTRLSSDLYDRQFVTPFVKTRLAASSPGAGARQRPGDRKGVRPSENQIRF